MALLSNELLQEIGSYLEAKDIGNARATSRVLANALMPQYCKGIRNQTVYPTQKSVGRYSRMLKTIPLLPFYIQSITLVCHGFKQPNLGRRWHWNKLVAEQGLTWSNEDKKILTKVDRIHVKEKIAANRFIFSGQYRQELCKFSLFAWWSQPP